MPASPIDIAARHTADFIQTFAAAGCDVLEIGCGAGEVAQKLQAGGFNVTAIDADKDAAAAARARGVEAFAAAWPDFESEEVDVVVFTRSLHHIHDLKGAVHAAHARLREGGVLLVEDFAFDQTDERTIEWFQRTMNENPLAGALKPPPQSLVADVLSANDVKEAWGRHHHHDLHSIDAMAEAIAEAVGGCEKQAAPYLYRYLIACLRDTAEAAALLVQFLEKENEAIAEQQITPLGRRIIARKNAAP